MDSASSSSHQWDTTEESLAFELQPPSCCESGIPSRGNQSPPGYGLMATEGSAEPARHTLNAVSVSEPMYHLPPHKRGSAKQSSPPQTQPAPQSRPAATGSAAAGPAPPGSSARDGRGEQQARASARRRASVRTECRHTVKRCNSLVSTLLVGSKVLNRGQEACLHAKAAWDSLCNLRGGTWPL